MKKIDRVLQKDILSIMLNDSESIYRVKRVVKPNFFSIKAYRFLYKFIIEYNAKYDGELPSKKNILLHINKKIKDDDIRKGFRKKLVPLFGREVESPKGILSEVQEWAEKQSFGIILEKAAKEGQEGNIGKAKDLIKASFLFDAYESDFDVHSLFEEWKARQKQRKKESKSKKSKQIKTGLGVLDNYLTIKTNQPNFILLMGTSGIGKSIISINFGYYGVKADCNVAHFVFENTAVQTLGRYDSLLVKYPYHYLQNYNWTKRDLSAANKAMRRLRNKRSNCLKVIHAPVDTVSVTDIEAILREIEIRENWVPDMIVYDMLDDMNPSESQESFRLGVKKTAKDVKKQTEMRNIPIICTTHAKASAKGTRLRQESFSESYDRPRSADTVLTISQTPEQEDDHQAEIKLDKFRDGEGKVTILIDLLFRVMSIRFVEQLNIGDDDEESNTGNNRQS